MAGPGPNPVFATMRHEYIMQTMRAEGRASVAELAEHLSVTMETVRRDLMALERMGSVRRVHGGAVLTTAGVKSGAESGNASSPLIDAIARRAVEEIPSEGTILLDSGPLTLAIARMLPIDARLTVVTCDLAIAQLLAPLDQHTVLLTGGRMRRDGGAVAGPGAEAMLTRVLVDVGFVVTPAISVARGLTTESEVDAKLKSTMISASRRSVALVAGESIGREMFQSFADLAEIELIVTDSQADSDVVRGLERNKAHVVVVS